MNNIFKNIASFIIFNSTAIYGKFNYVKYNKTTKNAMEKSEKKLLKFLRNNKDTEFGKKFKFDKIKSIEEYQNKMPYTTYDDYSKIIERIWEKGEQKLLVKDKICYLARTSGTMGNYKKIPVVKNSFKPFLKCGSIFTWNLKQVMKKKKKGLMYGKVFNLSEMGAQDTPSGIRLGVISGYFTYSLKKVLPLTTCIPVETLDNKEKMDMMYIKARYALQERNIICINAVFMSTITDLINYIYNNYEMLIQDIEEGKINNSVEISKEMKEKLEKKLKPDKKRAEELREIFKNISLEEPFIPKIWKRLSLIIAICTGEFSPFETKIRKYCGEDVTISYSMYAASEATIACAFEPENKDYMLLYDSGFYEFIPTEGEEKPLLMKDLKVGKTYEIVVTNYSGLYRYRIKDVVRIVGFKDKVPLIQFAYRKGQIANVDGIHLTVEDLGRVIKKVEKEIEVEIADYSIYVNTDSAPSKLIVFLELAKKITKNIDLGEIFDMKLKESVEKFSASFIGVSIGKSDVHIVKSGTYKKYRDNKVKKGLMVNQIKTVRLIEKKEILDYFLASIESN